MSSLFVLGQCEWRARYFHVDDVTREHQFDGLLCVDTQNMMTTLTRSVMRDEITTYFNIVMCNIETY